MSARFLPEFITFTGVDEWTDPAELVALSDQYPIEWGLLFSPSRQGVAPRYPKEETIEWFADQIPVRWSAHLCGSAAREVVGTMASRYAHLIKDCFARCQINTTDRTVQPTLLAQWAASLEVDAILQCRGAFPQTSKVDVLFDQSGGRGVESANWPAARGNYFCGYAGGINPENAASIVLSLPHGGYRYWIDMESGVRDAQDRFDLTKVRAVCEAVYGPEREA